MNWRKIIRYDTGYYVGAILISIVVFVNNIPRPLEVVLLSCAIIIYIVLLLLSKALKTNVIYYDSQILRMVKNVYDSIALTSVIYWALFLIARIFITPTAVMNYCYWFFVGAAIAARIMQWYIEKHVEKEE